MYPWNNTSHPFDKSRNTILFFVPEAAVVPHHVAISTLAATMKGLGYKVLLVSCGNAVKRCPVLDMHNAPFRIGDQDRIHNFCNGCNQIHQAISTHYGLETISLSNYLNADDYHLVDQLIQNAGKDIVKLNYEGHCFGGLGIADFALVTKQAKSSDLDDEQLLAAQLYTQASILAYIGTKRIIAQHNITRVCAFNIYSYMLGAAAAAKTLDLPFINVTQVAHRDIDRQRYIILPRVYTSEIWRDLCHDWYRWKDLSIPADVIKDISDDLFVRELGLGAQHYSPARALSQNNLFETLNLDPNKKTVVIFTSGFDENYSIGHINQVFGAPPIVDMVPFTDQIEWIENVVEHIKKKPDLQLIVRVHPREGKNKREKFISNGFQKMQALAERTGSACRYIWPEDPVSSYDLGEIADLCLISWSTIGLEMARRGAPVLAAFRHVGNPDSDFIPWGGDTPEEYFGKFDSLLDAPATLDKVIHSFRSYSYFNFANSLRLDDIIPSPDHTNPAEFRMPKEALAIESVFINGISLPIVNLSRARNNQHPDMKQGEVNQIQKHLRELIYLYLCGSRPSNDYHLVTVNFSNHESTEQMVHVLQNQDTPNGVGILAMSGKKIAFRYNGEIKTRYSPMLVRIANLCAQKINTL